MTKKLHQYYYDKLRIATGIIAKSTYLSKTLYRENLHIHKQDEAATAAKNKPTAKVENGTFTISHSVPFIDTTNKSALEFSLLLLEFSAIEAMINSIADCTIRHNQIVDNLSSAEKNFLTETKEVFQNGKQRTQPYFQKLEDKLSHYPELFAKLYDQEFRLEKNNQRWELFLKAKRIRDDISHPKSNIALAIDPEILLDAAKVIYWLQEIIYGLYKACTGIDFEYAQSESYSFGLLSWMNVICNDKNLDSIKTEVEKHKSLKKEKG